MKILLTGAGGLAGRYIRSEFSEATITAIDSREALDLSRPLPEGSLESLDPDPSTPYDLIIHSAGTTDAARAMADNHESTVNLLHALSRLPRRPLALTLISCHSVYSPDAGEDVTEETPLHPADEIGRSKMLAEKEARLWAEAAGVPLTILRAGMLFGTGVRGEAAEMFRDVLTGRYIHVRGAEGRISVLCAYDLARAVRLTAGIPGIFNVADSSNPTWKELAEAMTANAGARKRMMTLPPRWADEAWRFARMLPAVAASLSPAVRERRSRSLTLSTEKLAAAIDWQPHDTLHVLSRTDKDYPYQEK